MFVSILIIISILFSVLLLRNVNIRNGNVVGSGAGIIFAVVFYYMIIPLIIIWFGYEIDYWRINDVLDSDFEQIFRAVVAVWSFLFVFKVSYFRYNNLRFSVFSEDKWLILCKRLVWFTFIVGGISFIIYISAFGGILNLLLYSEYLRSFSTSGASVVSYAASIMVIPARLIIVTPILCLSLIEKKGTSNIIYKFLWLISFVLALLFMLANAGRTLIILMLIIYLFPFLKKISRRPWTLLVICGCVSLPLLSILDNLFVYLSGGDWNYSSMKTIEYLPQFSYPICNVLNMQQIVDHSHFRWGQDFFTAFINLIPGVDFEASYVPTSSYYGGTDWKMTGGTPNDVITFGYLEFGILGVILMAYLLGCISGKIDAYIRQLGNSYALQVVTTSLIVNMFAYIVNSDIVSLVNNQMQLTIISLCLLYSHVQKKYRYE